jgi:hypothetical protein
LFSMPIPIWHSLARGGDAARAAAEPQSGGALAGPMMEDGNGSDLRVGGGKWKLLAF